MDNMLLFVRRLTGFFPFLLLLLLHRKKSIVTIFSRYFFVVFFASNPKKISDEKTTQKTAIGCLFMRGVEIKNVFFFTKKNPWENKYGRLQWGSGKKYLIHRGRKNAFMLDWHFFNDQDRRWSPFDRNTVIGNTQSCTHIDKHTIFSLKIELWIRYMCVVCLLDFFRSVFMPRNLPIWMSKKVWIQLMKRVQNYQLCKLVWLKLTNL